MHPDGAPFDRTGQTSYPSSQDFYGHEVERAHHLSVIKGFMTRLSRFRYHISLSWNTTCYVVNTTRHLLASMMNRV